MEPTITTSQGRGFRWQEKEWGEGGLIVRATIRGDNMVHFGTLWKVVVHYGTLCYTMVHYSALWYTLLHYGTLGDNMLHHWAA